LQYFHAGAVVEIVYKHGCKIGKKGNVQQLYLFTDSVVDIACLQSVKI
jgi:hypothetical protein